MFDFSIVTNWIHELLLSVMPEGWAIFIECIAVGVCIVALYAILAIVLIYMERKVCGFFQCRLGLPAVFSVRCSLPASRSRIPRTDNRLPPAGRSSYAAG